MRQRGRPGAVQSRSPPGWARPALASRQATPSSWCSASAAMEPRPTRAMANDLGGGPRTSPSPMSASACAGGSAAQVQRPRAAWANWKACAPGSDRYNPSG